MPEIKFFKHPNKLSNQIRFTLVCIGSALLGIWLTQNTIALRNILLWVGALLAVKYLVDWYRYDCINSTKCSISWLDIAPLIPIILIFVWVIIHYMVFSREPEKQFQELTSTWLRSFLGLLIGAGTGLVIGRSKHPLHFFLPILWLGLLISFLILFVQYIPKAFQKGSVFAVDWFSNYIYWAKFNGVLAGSLLMAGLMGLVLDRLRINYFSSIKSFNDRHKDTYPANKDASNSWQKTPHKDNLLIYIYPIVGICLTLYSFVFIFDAKAGVGMAVILISFWSLISLIYILQSLTQSKRNKSQTTFYIKLVSILLLVAILTGWFSVKHMKNNPGWETLLTDIVISADIDKHPNWQEPLRYGYPKREDGAEVRGNTYERVAMALVGIRIIQSEPEGYGVFRSFDKQIKTYFPDYKSHIYTHSAWIDFGLAFGLPILILILMTFLLLTLNALRGTFQTKLTVISILLVVLVLYSVGEYAFQQSVEILFFIYGLILTLSWKTLE